MCAAVAAPAELLPPVQAGTAGGLLLAVVFCKRLVVNRSEDVKITFDVVEDEGGVHLVPHALVHVVEDGLNRPVLLQLILPDWSVGVRRAINQFQNKKLTSNLSWKLVVQKT